MLSWSKTKFLTAVELALTVCFPVLQVTVEMNYKIAPTYYTRLLGILENARPGNVLLNAGCGTGEFNYYLRDRFEESVGVDINEADIATARELTDDSSIRFETGSILELSFADDSFDTVICVDVLEHVERPDVALAELRRVLKPGGQLVVTVPHAEYPFSYDPINFILERVRKTHLPIGIWGFGHDKLFDRTQLERLIRDAGFHLVKTELLTHGFCGFLEGYIPTVLQPLFKSNAGNQAEVRVRKRREQFWHFSYDIPALFAAVLNALVALDRRMGRDSRHGVGVLVEATVPKPS